MTRPRSSTLSSVSTRIKFCGCTSVSDVELAQEAGADYFGMIFAPSPRQITWDGARAIASNAPAGIAPVAVFVNPSRDEIARVAEMFEDLTVQLSGDESPDFVASISGNIVKAIHLESESEKDVERLCERYPQSVLLFDTRAPGKYGGTGQTFDWSTVRQMARWRRCMIGGGLTHENVGELVSSVMPFGVDVRSGIETHGRKDAGKMRAFVQAVREHDAA